MKTLIDSILSDQHSATDELSFEENLMAMSCAQRILDHLKRHQVRSGEKKYEANIELLEQMVSAHKSRIDTTHGWSNLKETA